MSADLPLWGAWRTVEATGTSTLDWTGRLKDGSATAAITLAPGALTVTLSDDQGADITDSLRHVRRESEIELQGDVISIAGDPTGVVWTFYMSDEQLVLKLTGAARFGRCNGVDHIYCERVEGSPPSLEGGGDDER